MSLPRARAPLAGCLLAALALAQASCEIALAPAGPRRPAKIVMGYYAASKRPELGHADVDFRRLTHVAHAFAWPDPSGNLVVPPRFLYPELNAAARAAGVRMLVSLGGWGNCAGFPGMASSAAGRARFVGQVVAFCEANGYDGVDVDWEFVDGETEKADFSLFIETLGAALRSRTPALLLTMAAPAENYHGRWIDLERLAGAFDYIGFMTYNYHGAWSAHSGHNSPLYAWGGDACGSVDGTFGYARGRGVPPEKILLGLPFYGRSFDCGGLGLPFRESRSWSYAEVMALPPADWARTWDAEAGVPWLRRRDGGMIISFDDPSSVALKCRYVKDRQAGGVVIWELSGDRRSGASELLEAVGTSFGAR